MFLGLAVPLPVLSLEAGIFRAFLFSSSSTREYSSEGISGNTLGQRGCLLPPIFGGSGGTEPYCCPGRPWALNLQRSSRFCLTNAGIKGICLLTQLQPTPRCPGTCRPGWSQTERTVCLCLPSVKGVHHRDMAPVVLRQLLNCPPTTTPPLVDIIDL